MIAEELEFANVSQIKRHLRDERDVDDQMIPSCPECPADVDHLRSPAWLASLRKNRYFAG